MLDVEARTVARGRTSTGSVRSIDSSRSYLVLSSSSASNWKGVLSAVLSSWGCSFSIHASVATMTVSGSPAKSVISALTV
jgi:hypothetical protein